VYCAYPLLTLNQRGIIHPQCWNLNKRPKIKMLSCVAKYRDRGFDIVRDPVVWPDCAEHACHRSGTCPHTVRSVDDRRGLWIQIQPQDRNDSRNLVNTIYSTVWTLGGECKGSKIAKHFVHTSSIIPCEWSPVQTAECITHHSMQIGLNWLQIERSSIIL
jgi:hypothetical protein